MSVQLTVYPQWYNGVVNPITAVGTNQMLSDPQNFTSVGSGVTIPAPIAQTAQFGVNYWVAASMVTNTWYGMANDSVGALSGSFGNCTYYQGYECILQKINGLVQGGLYDGRITWNPVMTPQTVMVKIFNGTTLVTNITATPTASDDATFQFTAPSTNDTIIVIDYANAASAMVISSVSVKGAPVQPPQAIQNISNGSVICDLYEDEDLPLTLSVDNFKNAAEQVQSYSKAFNLPATKRNNQIFDNIFEITRSVDSNSILFNPYRKTKAVLKQDGFLIFEGYLRMLDISEKDGEISYNVNLYAEVTALADTLGERTFSDLDFSELEHNYNISNITDSWDGLLPVAALPVSSFANNTGVAGATTTNVLKYPNVDWNHQVSVDTSGNPVLSNLECAFRPFIKLKYCIDMIFAAPSTPFSYTSSFFNGAEFGNLYMDFNWGSGNAPVVFNSSAIVFRNSPQALTTSFATLDFTSSSPATLGSEFGYSSGVFTAQTDNQFYNISYDIHFEHSLLVGAPEQITIQWIVNGVPTNTDVSPLIATTSSYNYQGVFSTILSSGDTILCQAKSTGTNLRMIGGQNLISVITSSDQTTTATLLQTLRGELGQWDFLKGIMTMFNLVTMPDPGNPNNLLIEPYADVFITPKVGANLASRGVEYDWTDKVDISEMKLNPLTDLSLKTIFKFVEDDDDFCFNEYKRQVRHLYGSLTYSAVEFNILTGTEEIVAEPFAATVIKQLESQYADFIIPALYAKGDDGECSGFDNSPRIMYNDGKKTLTSCTYRVPAQNGSSAIPTASTILQFSHLSAIPTIAGSTVDYNFGGCQLVNGVTPVSANLFTRFWLPYYAQLYNPDTRTMTIKVNLNAGDINRFKFNDKVFIKNRIFRVNKIDYKPNDLATVEFILIG